MKKYLIRSLFLVSIAFLSLLLCGSTPNLHAQETKDRNNEIPRAKERLLILSSKDDPLNMEVTNIIASEAARLGRYDVIDRNNLPSILKEQALQLSGLINDSMVVNVGNIAAAKEGLLISVRDFYHKKHLSGMFMPHLFVQVKKIDIGTGETLQDFDIVVKPTQPVHTLIAETRSESEEMAMKAFRQRAKEALQNLYLMNSEVLSVDNREVMLILGEDIGIKKGSIFIILEPEAEETSDDDQFTGSRRKIALVSVADVSSDVNRSVVLRQWGSIHAGNPVMEQVKSIHGFQLNIVPSLNNSYSSIGVQYRVRPIQKRDWGGGFRFFRYTDSRDDKNSGVGLDLFGTQRLVGFSRISFLAKAGFDLNYAWRHDDEDRFVNTFFLSAYPGLSAEIVLAEKFDLVVNSGYRFGGSASSWQRPGKWVDEDTGEESDTSPGVWHSSRPEINMSGFFLTLGLKLLIF